MKTRANKSVGLEPAHDAGCVAQGECAPVLGHVRIEKIVSAAAMRKAAKGRHGGARVDGVIIVAAIALHRVRGEVLEKREHLRVFSVGIESGFEAWG